MWICLNDGFVSIVQDPARAGHMLVRARRKAQLTRLFPGRMPISRTPQRDYRWRVSVPASMIAQLVCERIKAIDYGNFKDSVKEPKLHDMYSLWWHDHHKLQGTNWRMNDE